MPVSECPSCTYERFANGDVLRQICWDLIQVMMNGRPTIKTTYFFRPGEAPENYAQVCRCSSWFLCKSTDIAAPHVLILQTVWPMRLLSCDDQKHVCCLNFSASLTVLSEQLSGRQIERPNLLPSSIQPSQHGAAGNLLSKLC